jgi:hypothetical protein
LCCALVPAEQGIHLFDSLRDPLFQQGEKKIFLTLEVRVESAAGIAGLRGDVLQSRRFKTIASKEPLGRLQ